MTYRTIGLMSGSSLDGLDIVFTEFQETSGKWSYQVQAADCYPYPPEWKEQLKNAIHLSAQDYLLLHSAYGRYLGEQVNRFIEQYNLQYRIQLIASHGHTTFHMPGRHMTAQLGDGAAIAATTGINVVSDLRAMDVALGGQGAPIVPVGEKALLGDFPFFLNLGGIANLSCNATDQYIAFDVCPANRVLNMLAAEEGQAMDAGGAIAATGQVYQPLLDVLNGLDYYTLPAPKSLSNDFGTDVVFPLIKGCGISTADALRTYTEHIAIQVGLAVAGFSLPEGVPPQLLVTGGGAHNTLLIERLTATLQQRGIELMVPRNELIDYKEAIVMGLLGLLRWREENNVFHSVTGATRSSSGGAVWLGQEV